MEEHQQATQALFTLLRGLPYDRALWEQITTHLENMRSHLYNALQQLPEEEKGERVDWHSWARAELEEAERIKMGISPVKQGKDA